MIDVSEAALSISDAMTSIASIAVAVLALLVIPKLFRWMKYSIDSEGVPDGDYDGVTCSECDSVFTMDAWDEMGGVCPDCGSSGVDWFTGTSVCVECGEEIASLRDRGDGYLTDDYEPICNDCWDRHSEDFDRNAM